MGKEKSLINQVTVINEKHETIKSMNGENFNIFSILNLERKEVDTHSYFIYDLLNLKGSHNQGDTFLQIFLKQILKEEEYKKVGSTSKATVAREKVINNAKRIDFTIETSNFFIAIEMKIDARDQDNQLYDYYEYSKNQKKDFKLFYLTLDGKEADEKSTKSLKVNEDYFLLSFQYDIYTWIEACIEKVATIPTIREGLVHYRNLIRKLTNQMGDEMAEDIRNIIKTKNDMQALHRLYSEYANVLAKKEVEFWKKLYDKINKIDKFKVCYLSHWNKGDSLIDYKIIAEKRKSTTKSHFGLTLSKEIKNFKIRTDIYSIDKGKGLIMDIVIYKDNNATSLNTSLSILLKEIGFSTENRETLRWFYLKEKIKFYGREEPTFELFDDQKFKELVESTSNEVVETLKKILEKEDELLGNI